MALEGLVFSFLNVSAKKKKDLATIIADYGGEVAYLGKFTHLIATPEDIKENGSKITAAKEKGVQVITEQWIMDKIKGSKPKPKVAPVPIVTDDKAIVPVGATNNEVTNIRKPALPSSVTSAPSITMVLPNSGAVTGTYKVAIFGINFIPSTNFVIQFGTQYVCRDIEFHCSTAIIATVTVNNLPTGEVPVFASNDGGKSFGPTGSFRFYDSETAIQSHSTAQENLVLLQGQLDNVKRSISQLHSGLINVQKVEWELRSRLDKAAIAQADEIQQLTFGEEEETPVVTQQPENLTSITTSDGKERKMRSIKQKTDDREIRLFISSPFKDMQEERDLIAKKIVPHLRKLCTERDIGFSFVDLRWGVTGVQGEQAATLLMCLREIERSNLFLGLYGERYGWSLSQHAHRNPSAQDELLKRTLDTAAKEFPWLNEYRDRSVTEIEMRMVLDKAYSGDEKYAWFFLRDPYYIENVPKDKQSLYESEGEYEHQKLSKLKVDLADSGYPNRPYPNPNQMAEQLLVDLEYYINQNYPKGSELSPLESERFRQNAYAKALTKSYLPNEKNFMVLDKHASNTINTPLLVLGENGIGKSALLANWAKRYKEHHPEDLVVAHYIGCSPTSTSHISMLARIMSEVQEMLSDFKTPVPSEAQLIVELFPSWLEKILSRNKRHRLVLIIDGLDNLDDRDNALDLVWLPPHIVNTVRAVLSLTPTGRVYQVIQRRKYETFTLQPLQEAERISFLRNKLNEGSKKLSEKQEFKIAAANQSGNPRYLQTLIEDLSLWGEFDALDKKIERDLKAQNASELYEIVFTRLETDYDTDKKVVTKFLSYLWGARRGLYLETELALLLEERKIEHHEWSAIYAVLEEFLFSSGGLINFANRDIRKAVENRYLNTPEKKKEVYLQLATFFNATEGFSERKAEELPWLLEQAQDWEKLKKCIADLRIFDRLYKSAHKFDLFRYWRQIESNIKVDAVTAYSETLNYTGQFPSGELVASIFYRVAYFLEEIGKYEGSEKVYIKARYYYQLSAQPLDVAKMEYSLARVLILMARYREAEEFLKKALEAYVREKGKDDIDVSHVLLRLGSLYSAIGRLTEAEDCLEKCMRIREEKMGANSSRVGQTWKHMLSLYEEQGNLPKAVECGEKALKIAEEQYGPEDPAVGGILLRLGHIFGLQKKYKESKAALKRSLEISENKYGRNHPSTADVLYELGCFYFLKPETVGKGNSNKQWTTDKAEKILEEALKIKEAAQGPNHPDVSRIINRLGSLYVERVQFDRAEVAFTRALKIREDKLGKDHARVAQTLRHLITLYELQEKIPDAIKAATNCLRITKKINGEDSTQAANVELRVGQLYFTQDGHTSFEGKKHLKNVIAIREKKLGKEHAQTVEAVKLLAELETPPEAPAPPPVAKPTVVAKPKIIREEEKPAQDDLQLFSYVSSVSTWDDAAVLPESTVATTSVPSLPPPPPPPLPKMAVSSRPPPPPPPMVKGGVAPPRPAYINIQQEISAKPVKLQTKQHVAATNVEAKQGWWKQNYKYKK